jgi:hypothetical protein
MTTSEKYKRVQERTRGSQTKLTHTTGTGTTESNRVEERITHKTHRPHTRVGINLEEKHRRKMKTKRITQTKIVEQKQKTMYKEGNLLYLSISLSVFPHRSRLSNSLCVSYLVPSYSIVHLNLSAGLLLLPSSFFDGALFLRINLTNSLNALSIFSPVFALVSK